MNRTLEKIAAAIFKSWFIDFDPVHAKAEGRDPNLPADIADLFPDTFQDSELGLIPEGWHIGPVSKLANLQTKTVKPNTLPASVWHHYSIPAFDACQQPADDRGETIKSNKYAVPETAVLVSKLNPRFPRIWLPDVADPTLAICSTEFMPFVPVVDEWRPYLYELMKSEPMQDAIKSRVTGSTGSRQRVKPKEIATVPIPVPPSSLIDAYSAKVSDLHHRFLANQGQSRSLAHARDTMLPKLLSGEVELAVEA